MRTSIQFTTIAILSSLSISCASVGNLSSIFGTKDTFTLRPYKQRTLENGMKVYFVHDNSLPRVSLTMLVKAGSAQESTSKAGLNAMTAYLLEQGTANRNATQIADDFGKLGSSLDVSPGFDNTMIFSDSLSKHSEQLLNLFTDVVISPSFEDSELSRIRSQLLANIQKKVDNPSAFANDKIDEFVFGDHPYGRDIHGDQKTLKAIGKLDVTRHYLNFYRPNNATLAIVGQFDEDFEKKVVESFEKWSRRDIPQVKLPEAPASDKLQVKLFVKKGLQQAQVRISTLGISRSNPDYLKLKVSNEIFGGSFASRLNQKIRSELGLTYSISSGFDVRKERGSFDIATFTKNETAAKTVDETLATLRSFIADGVSGRELTAARNQLVGQFPTAFETADRFAYLMLVLDFYSVPFEYLTKYNKNVEAVSEKDAMKAFKKVVNPQKMKIVVYGNESIIEQFAQYNPVIVEL